MYACTGMYQQLTFFACWCASRAQGCLRPRAAQAGRSVRRDTKACVAKKRRTSPTTSRFSTPRPLLFVAPLASHPQPSPHNAGRPPPRPFPGVWAGRRYVLRHRRDQFLHDGQSGSPGIRTVPAVGGARQRVRHHVCVSREGKRVRRSRHVLVGARFRWLLGVAQPHAAGWHAACVPEAAVPQAGGSGPSAAEEGATFGSKGPLR